MTNLGNSLDAAHRWIEAYECYQSALDMFPKNGVASGCAARVLLRVASIGNLRHSEHLADVALKLAHHSKEHADTTAALAGPDAASKFAELPSRAGKLATSKLRDEVSDYEAFVARNRLILSPILEGLGHAQKRWDDAHIKGISEQMSAGAEVPPIFAMFNVMKADYLLARELLYLGFDDRTRDTRFYIDTLDYAVYGVQPARLVLAQRSALDLLDKVAVALNEYLAVGKTPKAIYFHSFWREKRGGSTWHQVLADAINEGNVALVALSEIAADLSSDASEGSPPALLHEEKMARHAGTHRFTVLHDLAIGRSRPSPAVEHRSLDAFQHTALRTVRLARAALLHFLEVVAYSEQAKQKDQGPVGELYVHPHHKIRGED